jgi:hypothetical protein
VWEALRLEHDVLTCQVTGRDVCLEFLTVHMTQGCAIVTCCVEKRYFLIDQFRVEMSCAVEGRLTWLSAIKSVY